MEVDKETKFDTKVS